MKRSKSIRLIFLGSISAGVLSGCGPAPPVVSESDVYTNNYYVPGAGYYHAPFRCWYALPYNYYDAQRKQYYYGGRWEPAPFESVTNISNPTEQVARRAESMRTDISRGGFGSTGGGGNYFHS